MILANFKAWKSVNILLALVVISVIFALLPPMQKEKNKMLFQAVAENNVTKAKQQIANGAVRNLLLPTQLPLISLAIEYGNEAMVELLLDETIDIGREYGKGYQILQHAIEKENKRIITLLVDAYAREQHGK